jgi:hypothetical protein
MTDFKTRYGVKVYVDPNADSNPMIAKYKGKKTIDVGAFYAPYIPLQMVNSMQPNKIAAQGAVWGWTTFMIHGDATEIIAWCRANLGKQHRGIYLAGLGIWLGNGGRWRADGRSIGEIGIIGSYTRIWLKKDEDIALFKMVWA